MRSHKADLLTCLLVMGFVVGCGSKKEILGSNPTFSSLYTGLFSKSCVTCHQPGGSAWTDGINLDFSSQPAAYSSLTSLRSTALHCTSLSLVQSGSPSRSVLLAVLFDDYSTIAGTSCVGDAIHRDQNGNTASGDKSSLVSWIEQGALNN